LIVDSKCGCLKLVSIESELATKLLEIWYSQSRNQLSNCTAFEAFLTIENKKFSTQAWPAICESVFGCWYYDSKVANSVSIVNQKTIYNTAIQTLNQYIKCNILIINVLIKIVYELISYSLKWKKSFLGIIDICKGIVMASPPA